MSSHDRRPPDKKLSSYYVTKIACVAVIHILGAFSIQPVDIYIEVNGRDLVMCPFVLALHMVHTDPDNRCPFMSCGADSRTLPSYPGVAQGYSSPTSEERPAASD
ncbi:hypothetical protein WMY93_006689 [Mugilogobius chulae]|uniref:Uncharacterized protein n=1 Tax=Mugilogobius chulae TaxID=88201 RepID=A0AAW0PW36_9GOBI